MKWSGEERIVTVWTQRRRNGSDWIGLDGGSSGVIFGGVLWVFLGFGLWILGRREVESTVWYIKVERSAAYCRGGKKIVYPASRARKLRWN